MEGKEEASKNRNVNFKFSYDDLLNLNKLMTFTYCFTLTVASERGMGTHKKFSIFAPANNNTWYRGEGFSLQEAIDDWMERVTRTNHPGE